MKNIIGKIIAWFNAIGKDKYMHFTIGALSSLFVLIACSAFGAWWPLSLAISIEVVLAIAIIKERSIDPKCDMKDIAATILGGAVCWTAFLLWVLL